MHGDKAQHDRTKALSLFKEGKCPLMVRITCPLPPVFSLLHRFNGFMMEYRKKNLVTIYSSQTLLEVSSETYNQRLCYIHVRRHNFSK